MAGSSAAHGAAEAGADRVVSWKQLMAQQASDGSSDDEEVVPPADATTEDTNEDNAGKDPLLPALPRPDPIRVAELRSSFGGVAASAVAESAAKPGEEDDDPHNVKRFVSRQAIDHSSAVRQLSAGHKSGCWSWWIMPTPPFIKNGREVGSGMNAEFAIRSDKEAKAYLRMPPLRANYIQVMTIVYEQCEAGTSPQRLLGIDVPRAEASARFFRRVADLADDEELARVCDRVLAGFASRGEEGAGRGQKRSSSSSTTGTGLTSWLTKR